MKLFYSWFDSVELSEEDEAIAKDVLGDSNIISLLFFLGVAGEYNDNARKNPVSFGGLAIQSSANNTQALLMPYEISLTFQEMLLSNKQDASHNPKPFRSLLKFLVESHTEFSLPIVEISRDKDICQLTVKFPQEIFGMRDLELKYPPEIQLAKMAAKFSEIYKITPLSEQMNSLSITNSTEMSDTLEKDSPNRNNF